MTNSISDAYNKLTKQRYTDMKEGSDHVYNYVSYPYGRYDFREMEYFPVVRGDCYQLWGVVEENNTPSFGVYGKDRTKKITWCC